MLKSKLAASSCVGPGNIFESDGVLINSSNIWPVPAISVADRTHFKAFKAASNSPSLLVEPTRSRLTGAWTTILARKLTGQNEEYLGSISSEQRAHFERFFATKNQRCIDMYGLSREIVKPGCSFREVIAHRKGTGSFVGDVDAYCDWVMVEDTG